VRILAISDIVIPLIYSPQARKLFSGVDIVIACGDLPNYYLEYIISTLDAPMFFVRGNHYVEGDSIDNRPNPGPRGGINLHRSVARHRKLLLAGVEGCLQYREGPNQYTQDQMWRYVIGLIPALLINRLVYGRFLDIFATHAPPAGIHDQKDLPHRGIKAFRWLLRVFKPSYHFHGHIHVYRPDTVIETVADKTCVMNVFGYREVNMKIPEA
jgi:uncharacterized protein